MRLLVSLSLRREIANYNEIVKGETSGCQVRHVMQFDF